MCFVSLILNFKNSSAQDSACPSEKDSWCPSGWPWALSLLTLPLHKTRLSLRHKPLPKSDFQGEQSKCFLEKKKKAVQYSFRSL